VPPGPLPGPLPGPPPEPSVTAEPAPLTAPARRRILGRLDGLGGHVEALVDRWAWPEPSVRRNRANRLAPPIPSITWAGAVLLLTVVIVTGVLVLF
jgi:hypothetical protein